MQITGRACQKFVSETFCDTEGWLPIGALLVVGWTISGASFITSLWILPYDTATALLILVLTSVLVSILWRKTERLAMQSSFKYELIISDTEATLYTYDLVDRRQLVQSVLLRDVSTAECFIAGDVATVTLITPGRNLEIPLWTFGTSRRFILQTLRARGVRIVDLEQILAAAA